MKAGAGKGKGSSFERAAGKDLSLWLTGGADSTQFVRSSLSGGWSRGLSGQAPWRHVGDLAPNGLAGDQFRRLIAVECKHHRKIDLRDLWSGKKGSLLLWWQKIVDETGACGASGMHSMLIFRANFMPSMVVVSQTFWDIIADGGQCFPNCHAAHFRWLQVVVFPFDHLLKSDPEWFLAQGRRLLATDR